MMKNVLFLALLIGFNWVSFAQKRDFRGQLDVNAGYCFNHNWNINSPLKQRNMPIINPVSPYFGVNADFSYKSLFFLTEIGFTYSDNKINELIYNKYKSFTKSACVGYIVIHRPYYGLKIGGSIANSSTRLSSYDYRPSFGFDPFVGFGRINLSLNPISVGVMAKLEFYNTRFYTFGFIFSYSRNVANNVWSSSNKNINNAVRETGSLFSIRGFLTLKRLR